MTDAIHTLVIAPHVDDEVLGCGGLLGPGCHVYFCGVEEFREVSREERLREAGAAADLLGHTWECNPATTVNSYREQDFIGSFEGLIGRLRPRRVCIPHPGYNQDHCAVYRAAFVALRPHDRNFFVRQVLVYEGAHDLIWNPQELPVNYFIPIDIERKIAAYRCHASQVRGMRSPDLLRAIAELRGSAGGLPYAEAYRILRWVEEPPHS